MSARSSSDPVGHRDVLGLSWPIMVSMLSYTVMTVADSIFVGQLGTPELAALGLSAALIHAAASFGHGLISGVRVAVARSWGARQQSLARRYAWQGVWLALGLGVLVATLAPFGRPAFVAMGASPQVAELAAAYYGIRTASAPVLFLFVALSAWFQGRGDTRTPMVASVLANVLNVALDPVLIFGLGPVPALGVHGAAWATVAGLAAGAALLAAVGARELTHRITRPSRALLRPIWAVGSPKGVQELLDVASFVVFSSLLAQAGDEHLAAHVIAVRILIVSFLPGFAISEASGVLVGQRLGAGRPEQARQAHRAATRIAVAFMVACGVVFFVAPDPLIAIFGAEDRVHALAVQVLLAVAAIQVFDALATVAHGSLSGAGDTRFVMGVTVIAAWAIKVPLAVLLVGHLELGVLGAWIAVAFEIGFHALLCSWRIRGDRWLQQDPGTVPARA